MLNAHQLYLRKREFCAPVGSAGWVAASAFTFHVENIVSLGADEKVRRSNTKSVVAPMAHDKAGFDISDEQGVGESVREPEPTHCSADAVSTAAALCAGPYKAVGFFSGGFKESGAKFRFAKLLVAAPCFHAAYYRFYC